MTNDCVQCGGPIYREGAGFDIYIHKKCDKQRRKDLKQYAKEASLNEVLNNIQRSRNPNMVISHIDINDKIECALWCGSQFEKMKQDYIDNGYGDESYEGFLVQTYVSTKESFPDTIKAELGAPN